MLLYKYFRQSMQFLLRRPVLFISGKVSSYPKRENVFAALNKLYFSKRKTSSSEQVATLDLNRMQVPIIIFSDQHKGDKSGADDFAAAERTYLSALEYYEQQKAFYINIGDSEELWKFNIFSILEHNKKTFEQEAIFLQRNAFCKIYGNHDTFWHIDPLATHYLKQAYGQPPIIYTAVKLNFHTVNGKKIQFLCTHGHQGDRQSDGNKLSIWFVNYIWAPLQNFLQININSPSNTSTLKTAHNQIMYEWSARQKKCILITGHTHQPVFNSLTHLERLYIQLASARKHGDTETVEKITREIPRRMAEYDYVNAKFENMRPSYFNTGCCCYNDGTITGIEIADGKIRLVKWVWQQNKAIRIVAEEEALETLTQKLKRQ